MNGHLRCEVEKKSFELRLRHQNGGWTLMWRVEASSYDDRSSAGGKKSLVSESSRNEEEV